MHAFFFLATSSVLLAGKAVAEDVVELESTVIGNQEQPKVLYIVPWKSADSLQRIDSNLPRVLDDVFEHREYSEFQREIELKGKELKKAEEQ
ncbi:cell division protein FtsY [Microbulbifer flavimaris]|uniref:Cell division protein FtsY n=1 Tax=Microbulbifer flavimaris TaxID=1781068 RepID=A0ABX4I0T3_9GAMM|nr:hypothetical protein AVO43_08340 [Microbulbifer sp. ZGT114]PCO05999.1 cell division protein FtsY [Microbulbifer flavimaris]